MHAACGASAPCACALVVTPVATVTVHSESAASVAVFAVRVSVASASPELDAATVKAVLPHPADVLMPAGHAFAPAGDAMVSKVGKSCGPLGSHSSIWEQGAE